MDMINLTPEQIRNASSSKLRSYLKEDIDVDLHDMISYEELPGSSEWLNMCPGSTPISEQLIRSKKCKLC